MGPSEVEDQAIRIMEQAAELTLGLADSEAEYDLPYLAENLARCSAYAERLAELTVRLTMLRVPTLREVSRAELDLEVAQAEQGKDPACQELPANKQRSWIDARTLSERRALREWQVAEKVLGECKAVVTGRTELMRRLDADLRLHQKILESRITAGAVDRHRAFHGRPRTEGDRRDVGNVQTPPGMGGGGDIVLD